MLQVEQLYNRGEGSYQPWRIREAQEEGWRSEVTPHMWDSIKILMGYVGQLAQQKGVTEEEAAAHFDEVLRRQPRGKGNRQLTVAGAAAKYAGDKVKGMLRLRATQ